MPNYTLSYSDSVQGWPSFYSFDPDWMIGMNNYLYTFKGGNLYRHNTNEQRNTFYQDWWARTGGSAFTPSLIQSVFNTAPLENKLFKTITIQGDDKWGVRLNTDLQHSGYIESTWFQEKEAAFFAFIRNTTDGQMSIRSTGGIGRSYQVVGGNIIKFSINPLISIGTMISIGDYIYFSDPPNYSDYRLAGEVISIQQDYPNGINQLTINTSIPSTSPITTQDPYIFYTKNSVAESHGVLGHYCEFFMTNANENKIELFTVESDVMKSFP